MTRQGDALVAMGKTTKARFMFEKALAGRVIVFGKDHSETRAVAVRLSALK